MKKTIALFDFDKTLTDTDSIILIWQYALKNKKVDKLFYYKKLLMGSVGYLSKSNFKVFKSNICQVINYLSEDELKDFAKYVYENHMLSDGIKYLNSLSVDYKMLVSASPINYLKYFYEYLDFDVIIGTELDENCNLLKENNKSQEKVKVIKEHLSSKKIEIDYENSMAFSDSYKDDKPMLSLVKNRFLINSRVKDPEYTNLNWK
ncbi:HAD-superfamily hydrolase, subfamily IB [Peptoniphilus sp. ING2-D1G]|nr:HAD-superfamily hydrolase, subfamily IB [Peptoniphilus sp. ING2-D1G]